MPLVTIDGADLYYEETGSGDPVLFIGATPNSWREQISHLAQRFKVVYLEMRGIGHSPRVAAPPSIPQMAQDIAAAVTALRLGPVRLIGSSLGGRIAQEVAITRPDVVARLILIATAARLRRATLAAQRAREYAGKAQDQEAYTISRLTWLYGRSFLGDLDRVEAELDAVPPRFPLPPPGWARVEEESRISHSTLGRLDRITAPTLVIVGADDILSPPIYARELAQGIPNAKLVILPRGGHSVSLEFPELVNEAIGSFLSES